MFLAQICAHQPRLNQRLQVQNTHLRTKVETVKIVGVSLTISQSLQTLLPRYRHPIICRCGLWFTSGVLRPENGPKSLAGLLNGDKRGEEGLEIRWLGFCSPTGINPVQETWELERNIVLYGPEPETNPWTSIDSNMSSVSLDLRSNLTPFSIHKPAMGVLTCLKGWFVYALNQIKLAILRCNISLLMGQSWSDFFIVRCKEFPYVDKSLCLWHTSLMLL